ncbi:MAG TPA: zf-HC2 domain-containing protein [Mycobacteriales bacterium]|nr:zf-HC2 domain-containing protein [Mycobacteriales bacterium]
MTPPTSWHPGEELLQSYVDGGLPGLSAGSVEAHLLNCADCRAQIGHAVEPRRLVQVKEALDDRLDEIARPRTERFLVRLGVDECDARALLAAPSMRRAWWLAVLGAAALGLLALGNTQDPTAVFLALAPLVPLGATAAAYAPALDAAFALVSATPYRTTRLLLARSLAVGTTSLVAIALASLAIPQQDLARVVWLLPSVALTLVVLSLAPRLGAGYAAGGVAVGWLLVISTLETRGIDVDWLAEAAAQVVWALLAAVAFAAVVHQWHRIDTRGIA